MRSLLTAALAVVIVGISGAAALADDWVAVRLRGTVLQLVDGDWVKLPRGGMVPDSRVIRTLKTGNVEFHRGNESVTIGPDTQIQIFDEKSAKPFTTVKQYFGTVTVQAEVRQVQHFAVQTPYLAAVVKGTQFRVSAEAGGSTVDVLEGQVDVSGFRSGEQILLLPGQTAKVASAGAGALNTSGSGLFNPVRVGPPRTSPVQPEQPKQKFADAGATAPAPPLSVNDMKPAHSEARTSVPASPPAAAAGPARARQRIQLPRIRLLQL